MSWREMLAAARERANLTTERVPLWRVSDWGLKLISRLGVVPFPDLVNQGLYVEEPEVMQALLNTQLTVWTEGADTPEVISVADLIAAGRAHPLEIESVARVDGGFFGLLGALIRRIAPDRPGGREADSGWDQVYLQRLPDEADKPSLVGLAVDLSGSEPRVLVQGQFEATGDHAEGNTVLTASYAVSWANLNGAHGKDPDPMNLALSRMPTLLSAPGSGGSDRGHFSLTLKEWVEGDVDLSDDRYAWMTLAEVLDAQTSDLTTPHLDAMLGRLLTHLAANGWLNKPAASPD